MIRAMAMMMGILMLTAACSQFGHTPTAPPPMPNTPTPIPVPSLTPTPTATATFEWKNLFFRCSINEYEDAWVDLNLHWSDGAYTGNFFLTHIMARARVLLHPPEPLLILCTAIDARTWKEWDRPERLRFLKCTLTSIDGPHAIHEFRLTDYGPAVLYEYRPSTFYLDVDLASKQANQPGLFHMQVACVPSSVYSDF